METYIDLSNGANSTITFDFWAPVQTFKTYLLKLEKATNRSKSVELSFNFTMRG